MSVKKTPTAQAVGALAILVALAAAFGVELEEEGVNQAKDAVAAVVGGIAFLITWGRMLLDKVQARLEGGNS